MGVTLVPNLRSFSGQIEVERLISGDVSLRSQSGLHWCQLDANLRSLLWCEFDPPFDPQLVLYEALFLDAIRLSRFFSWRPCDLECLEGSHQPWEHWQADRILSAGHPTVFVFNSSPLTSTYVFCHLRMTILSWDWIEFSFWYVHIAIPLVMSPTNKFLFSFFLCLHPSSVSVSPNTNMIAWTFTHRISMNREEQQREKTLMYFGKCASCKFQEFYAYHIL